MPWARIDDGFLGHQKAERISDRVLGFWARGLLYAARNHTDGKLPRAFVRTKGQMAMADDLLRRGLWEKTHDGYLIHDYLAWNPSKKEIEKSRAQGKERYQRWLERQRENAVQVEFKRTDGKEGLLDTKGISSLPSPNGEKRPSPYQYPDLIPAEPLPDLTLEQRAENIKRTAEMARKAAEKMAMP